MLFRASGGGAARVIKMRELISNAAIQTFCVIGLKMSFFMPYFSPRIRSVSCIPSARRSRYGRSIDQVILVGKSSGQRTFRPELSPLCKGRVPERIRSQGALLSGIYSRKTRVSERRNFQNGM